MGNRPVDGPRPAEAGRPVDPCPRCGAETEGRDACVRCGLGRQHRERFATETALPPGLSKRWDAVLGAWDDAGVHAVFIETCAQAEALDLAAARYRALRSEPERAERCAKALDRIVALAESRLQKTSAGAERVVRNRRIIFAVGLVVMLVFLAVVAWAVLNR